MATIDTTRRDGSYQPLAEQRAKVVAALEAAGFLHREKEGPWDGWTDGVSLARICHDRMHGTMGVEIFEPCGLAPIWFEQLRGR